MRNIVWGVSHSLSPPLAAHPLVRGYAFLHCYAAEPKSTPATPTEILVHIHRRRSGARHEDVDHAGELADRRTAGMWYNGSGGSATDGEQKRTNASMRREREGGPNWTGR